jgi:hypothetical protein
MQTEINGSNKKSYEESAILRKKSHPHSYQTHIKGALRYLHIFAKR